MNNIVRNSLVNNARKSMLESIDGINDIDFLKKELKEHLRKEFDLQQRLDKAIELAYQYAQIDGSHHKMWTIDQMIRLLLADKYDKWVSDYEEEGEYSWDTGISP